MDSLRPADGSQRNPVAVIGFALSIISLCGSPVFFVVILLELAESDPPHVVGALSAAFAAPPYPALVLLWIGRQRARQRGAPHGRLALAGLWLLGISVVIAGIGTLTMIYMWSAYDLSI